ncbi:hypothetical protein ACP4OV_026481 [Aristida adscensionis]
MAGVAGLQLLTMWASPFGLRVQLSLGYKGLSYEYIEEKDVHDDKSELLLKSNPVHKKVPVLIHDGEPICKSQIIVHYIDEAFAGSGPALLPADPHERAMARFWAAYLDDKLIPSWWQSFKSKTEEDKAERVEQTLVAVEQMEAAFKEVSKGKPFFGGDSVGYMDVMLGGIVSWAHAGEELYGFRLFDAGRAPLLSAWVERFSALAWAKELLPDPGKLVERAKIRQAEREAAAAAAASR